MSKNYHKTLNVHSRPKWSLPNKYFSSDRKIFNFALSPTKDNADLKMFDDGCEAKF